MVPNHQLSKLILQAHLGELYDRHVAGEAAHQLFIALHGPTKCLARHLGVVRMPRDLSVRRIIDAHLGWHKAAAYFGKGWELLSAIIL